MWLGLALLLAAPPAAAPLSDLLSRAQERLQAGDPAGARRELVKAEEAYPGHPVVQNFLGVVAAEGGDPRAAEGHFKAALQKAPRYTDASLNLGRLLQQQTQADGEAAARALAVYESVLAYAPAQAEARYQSAVLRLQRGDSTRALADLDRMPAVDQERAGALAVRCAALLVQDRLKEAEAAAGRLLARADFGVADVDIILPFLRKGGEEVGVPVLEGLRARSLASADHLARLAQLHESGGRLDRARQALEEAARSRPESIELLLGLARIAEQQKDHRGALGYLAHARSREPGNARVHFLFGMVCVELELGVEAHASLVEAVRLDPGNASYNYALGAVALHRRDPSEAISYFRKYVELRPDDPRGGFALGIAAYQARDFRAARAELRPAAERKETSAAAYHYLGRMAREENDLEEALRLSQGAVQANPAYADAWAELGLVRFRRRELALAEEALVKCLEQQPESYAGNLHLLMLYERTKDPRHDEQARKFERIKAAREEQAEDFRRVIEVRPP